MVWNRGRKRPDAIPPHLFFPVIRVMAPDGGVTEVRVGKSGLPKAIVRAARALGYRVSWVWRQELVNSTTVLAWVSADCSVAFNRKVYRMDTPFTVTILKGDGRDGGQ